MKAIDPMDIQNLKAPDFYVVGAAKSGTTAVWSWLRQHPDVFLPAVKEPGFFAYCGKKAAPKAGPYDPDYVSQITTTTAEYARLYQEAGEKITGDVSPIYLIDPEAADRIASVRPDARIVILLRDPVTRAFSQFLHNRRDGFEPCSDFAEALAQERTRANEGWSWGHSYRANGEYADQIDRYLQAFPSDQILFWQFEDLDRYPDDCWDALCQHLGLAVRPLPENKRVNATADLQGVPTHQTLTRLIRHPGGVQKVLKSLVPAGLRTRLRRRIESAQSPMPELAPDVRADLIRHYTPERPQIIAQTGLSLTGWEG